MPREGNKTLVLAAMIFAVSMTFIDQTIVALAVPELQRDLGLSATGTQWIVNAYLLSLSALFAFGGLRDHRRADRDRPVCRRLPDRVDLAGDRVEEVAEPAAVTPSA